VTVASVRADTRTHAHAPLRACSSARGARRRPGRQSPPPSGRVPTRARPPPACTHTRRITHARSQTLLSRLPRAPPLPFRGRGARTKQTPPSGRHGGLHRRPVLRRHGSRPGSDIQRRWRHCRGAYARVCFRECALAVALTRLGGADPRDEERGDGRGQGLRVRALRQQRRRRGACVSRMCCVRPRATAVLAGTYRLRRGAHAHPWRVPGRSHTH
jgi:hypothetical protein